jgi:hypothetical protein
MPKFSITSISGLSKIEAEQDAIDVQLDARLDALEQQGVPEQPKWRNVRGDFSARTTGNTAPTLAAFCGGNTQRWFFATNNVFFSEFVLNDEFKPNINTFLRLHFGHNGTAINGNLVLQISMTYAKNNDVFFTEKVFNVTIPMNLTVAPRWGHTTTDIQITSSTPTATQFDSSLVEPDAELIISVKVVTLPTITGASTNGVYCKNVVLRQLS